jgi:hypothetical protein
MRDNRTHRRQAHPFRGDSTWRLHVTAHAVCLGLRAARRPEHSAYGRPCCRQNAVRLFCQKSTHISVPPRPYTWSTSPTAPTTALDNGTSVHFSIVLRRVLRQVSVSSAHASQVALRRSCASFVAEHRSCSRTMSPGNNQSHHHPGSTARLAKMAIDVVQQTIL